MRPAVMMAAAVILGSVAAAWAQSGSSFGEVQRYTVYCADDRIEVAVWNLDQMIVRRGNPVCPLASYTSYGDVLNFAKKNFGGEGAPCSC